MDFRQDVGEQTAAELSARGTCKFFQCEPPTLPFIGRTARWQCGELALLAACCAANFMKNHSEVSTMVSRYRQTEFVHLLNEPGA